MAYDADESIVEGIEGRYHFARSLVRGSRGLKREYERGIAILKEIFRETAMRETEGTILPADPSSSGTRAAALMMRLSPNITDAIITTILCEGCQIDYSPGKFHNLERGEDFKSVSEFVEFALLRTDESSNEKVVPCPKCKKECTKFIDFHNYNANANIDLVVRCSTLKFTPHKKYFLLWMEPDGRYRMVSDQEVPVQQNVGPDELAEAARNCFKGGDLEKLAEHIRTGLRKYPTTKAFLPLAMQLIETSKIGFAEEIAEQYIQSHPEDPLGYACSATVYLRGCMNAAVVPQEWVQVAEELADKSISKGKTAPGMLAKANAMRLKNLHPVDVAPVFESVVVTYPNNAEAYFYYALMWLPFVPGKALQHFQRACTLAPKDYRFAAGEARCLAALGQGQAAQEKLTAARTMAPSPGMADHLFKTMIPNPYAQGHTAPVRTST